MRIHEAAAAELRAAGDWYEGRRRGLGVDFVRAVRDIFTRIELLPETFPVYRLDHRVRRATLRRFPFAIFFALAPDGEAWVVAVAHERREPGYWADRL